MCTFNKSSLRHAISKIELLGCLVAVGGGAWIGAQYFGADLQGAAYHALDDAELLTQIPEEWRPVDPDCPNGDCLSEEAQRQLEMNRLSGEFGSLQSEVAKLAAGMPSQPVSFDTDVTLSADDQWLRDQTLAYWQKLSRVVFEVTSIDERLTPFNGTESHGQAVALRQRALTYGAKAAELLPTEGVDDRALETGVRVAQWFEKGAATLKASAELRTRQAVQGRAMSADEFWAQTEGDLRKRTELVRRKSAETSAYLGNRYFADFPPLAI